MTSNQILLRARCVSAQDCGAVFEILRDGPVEVECDPLYIAECKAWRPGRTLVTLLPVKNLLMLSPGDICAVLYGLDSNCDLTENAKPEDARFMEILRVVNIDCEEDESCFLSNGDLSPTSPHYHRENEIYKVFASVLSDPSAPIKEGDDDASE